jgi:preprotein translocase subunit YajC
MGKITEINGQYVTIELAANLTVKMQKSAIAAVLPKETLKSI